MNNVASKKKPTPRRIRSAKIGLTKPFLDDLHKRWHTVKRGEHPKTSGERVSMAEWGSMLAKGVSRPRPFDKGQLSRFLAGEQTSQDVLDAMCKFFGIPSPIMEPLSIAEVEWFAAGQQLSQLNRGEFKKLLRLIKAKVVSEKENLKLLRELESNPDK